LLPKKLLPNHFCIGSEKRGVEEIKNNNYIHSLT